MFEPAKRYLHPENEHESDRVFVVDGAEDRVLHRLYGRVLDVYCEVTGYDMSEHSHEEHTGKIFSKVAGIDHFEYRFGIPKLSGSARNNGKLWGKTSFMFLRDDKYKIAGFWIDTNDFDRNTPQPDPSREVTDAFKLAIAEVADREFAEISVPAPYHALHLCYWPDIASGKK